MMTILKLLLIKLEPEMQPSNNSRSKCQRKSQGKYPHLLNDILLSIPYLACCILITLAYRYAVFELEFQGSSGANESKIIFILYVPDVCSSNIKFVYATTKDAVRKKVQPFNKEV